MAKKNKSLNMIGNIIWLLFGGFILAVCWCILGIIFYITIIGIPCGHQCFKICELSFSPFGKDVDINFSAHPILNIIWAIFFGWELALCYIVAGIINCLTIVGIPFGIQSFKLAILALSPFGTKLS